MSGIKLTAEFILIIISIVAQGQKPPEKTSKFDTSIESYTVPVEIHSDELTKSEFQTEVEKDRSTEPFKETTETDRFATEKSNTYTIEDKLTTETEHISKTVTEPVSTVKIPESDETVAHSTTREPETKTVTSSESVTNVEPTQGSTVTETLLRTTQLTDPDLFTEIPDTSEDRTANFEELDDKIDSSEDLNYYQDLLSTRRMMRYGNDQQNVILDTKMRNAEAESVEPIYSASAPVDNVNNFFRNRLGTVSVVNKQRLFPQFFPAVTRPGYFYKPEFIKAAAPLLLTKIVKPDLRTVIKPNPAAIRQDPLPTNRQSIEDFNIDISDNAYPYLPLYENEQTKSIQSQKFKTETKSNEEFLKLPQENPFNDVFAKLVEASKHPTGEVIRKYGNIPDNILNRRIIGLTQDHIGYSKEILARALKPRLVQKHVPYLPYFLQ